jgi:hypothetical protein
MAFFASEASVETSRTRGTGLILNFVALAAILSLTACIAHAPGSGGGGQQQQIAVAVTSTPALPAFLPVSTSTTPSTVQLTATVTGTSNTAVTWSLAAAVISGSTTTCTASGAGLGTITGTGNTVTYTAPGPSNPLPQSPCGVAIIATSNEDNSTTGQALAKVQVLVTVSPDMDTIGQGANLQYTATVWGAPSGSTGVGWSATCTGCTSQQTGAGTFDINNPGLFVAGGLVTGQSQVVANILATSNFDTTGTGTAAGTTTLNVVANDPLGTVSPTSAAAAQITCPTFNGGLTSGSTCYQLSVSCDQIADWTVYLKVNIPPSGTTQKGTVIFAADGGGTALYDNDPSFIAPINGQTINGGDTVVDSILTTGFTTVQLSFGGAPFNSSSTVANGWLQGPGGVRRLACRYASVADWVYKNIHNSSTALPYCAVGNGSGAGAVGYAATAYPIANEFSLLEMNSGPLMTRLHQGCNVCGAYTGSNPCTQTPMVNMCYSTTGGGDGSTALIDTAYQAVGQTTPTLCSDGVNGVIVGGVSNPNYDRFRSDSIEWETGNNQPLQIPDPPTVVNVDLGALDDSSALPQGYAWWQGVTPDAPRVTCVPGAMQAIPAIPFGAVTIISDIQNECIVNVSNSKERRNEIDAP